MKRMALLLMMLFWGTFGYPFAYGQEYGGSEQLAATSSLQNTLEYNKTNEATTWVNPDTGESGSMVPVKTYQNTQGQYCREYLQTILIAGEKQQGYGTACRQPDGSWRIVTGNVATGYSSSYPQTVEKRTYVYVQNYPRYNYPRYYYPPYYYYPRGYYYPYYSFYPYYYYPYYPYSISLSFGYFYSSGHNHYKGHSNHGGHYSRGRYPSHSWQGGYGGHRGGHDSYGGRGQGGHGRYR